MPQPLGCCPPALPRAVALTPPISPQALVCYLEQLEDEEVQTRVAGCAALGCLKVRGTRAGSSRAATSRGRGIACGRRVWTHLWSLGERSWGGSECAGEAGRGRAGRETGREGTGRGTFLHHGAAAPCAAFPAGLCPCHQPRQPCSALRPLPCRPRRASSSWFTCAKLTRSPCGRQPSRA